MGRGRRGPRRSARSSATGLERAVAWLQEGPENAWDAPSRIGKVGILYRRVLRRVLRPYETRQREFERAVVDELSARSSALAELEAVYARLDADGHLLQEQHAALAKHVDLLAADLGALNAHVGTLGLDSSATPSTAKAVSVAGHPPPPCPEQHPRKLNLGCGWDKRDGYLNVDLHAFHQPDLVADVRNLSMLLSGHFEELVAQDILEHLKRDEIAPALAEWNRLLAPRGRIHLRTIDLVALGRWLAESDDPDRHRQVVHLIYGTQAYDGDYHLSGFTDVLLRDYLDRAGFGEITLGIRDGWLWEVEAVKVGEPRPPAEP